MSESHIKAVGSFFSLMTYTKQLCQWWSEIAWEGTSTDGLSHPSVPHPCKHTTAVSGAPTSPTLLGIISYLIVKQNLDSTVCISPHVPCPSSLLILEMILRLAIELNLCLDHLVFRSFFSLISNVHFVSLPSLTVLTYHPLLGETPYPLPRKVPWTLPLM